MVWREWHYWKKGIFIGLIYCVFSLFWGLLIFFLGVTKIIQDQGIINIMGIPIWPITKISLFLYESSLIDRALSSSNTLIEIFAFFIPLTLSAFIIILIFGLIGLLYSKIKQR